MGSELQGVFDKSGELFANIISNKLRSEVQIIKVDVENGEIIADNYVTKYELDADEKIIDVQWIEQTSNEATGKSKGKKRSVDSSPTKDNASEFPILSVLLDNSKILLFSPHLNQPTGKISPNFSISTITQSYNTEKSLLAFDPENHKVIEYSLNYLQLSRSINIKKTVDVRSIVAIPNDKKKVLLVSENKVYLANLSNSRSPVITEFESIENPIKEVKFSSTSPNKFAVLYHNSENIHILDILKPKELTTISTNSKIESIQVIPGNSLHKEFLFVIHESNIEVFEFEQKQPLLVIKLTNSTIPIKMLYIKDSVLYVVWYKFNNPKFTIIDWDLKSSKNIPINLQLESENGIDISTSQNIITPAGSELKNLPFNQLFSRLRDLLMSKEVDQKSVLDICYTNNNEESVKETIQEFSLSDETSLGESLFSILSDEVSADPSKSDALAIWLKWLLLSYGGAYSKSIEMFVKVKNLQQSLDNGMKLMPHLLALQGRLQLLRTQTKLRNETGSKFTDDSFYGNEQGEESITFANGENDDSELEDEVNTTVNGQANIDEEDLEDD
ncbi:uncharacterized protein RJT21DRAFT_17763 [Scheffersomyces amazonensis]|uniref:uncharacterized protein n=1 Tax=Scheffersomyces amazonensis TaxID=1078765 RepID=UPI00315CA7D4